MSNAWASEFVHEQILASIDQYNNAKYANAALTLLFTTLQGFTMHRLGAEQGWDDDELTKFKEEMILAVFYALKKDDLYIIVSNGLGNSIDLTP